MEPTTVGRERAYARALSDPAIRRAASAPSPFPRATIPGIAALVLADTASRRLAPLTGACATAALPLAGDLRLIDFTLGNCLNSGITRIGVVVGTAADSIAAHVDQRWAPFAAVHRRTIRSLPPPAGAPAEAGSAEALRRQLAFVAGGDSSRVLVLAGDQIYGMDYGALLADHLDSGAGLTLASIAPEPGARGLGPLKLGQKRRLTGIGEASEVQPFDDAPLAIGACLFEARLLRELLVADAAAPNSGHDLWHDLIPAAIRLRRAYVHRPRDPALGAQASVCWRGIAGLDDYWRSNLESAYGGLPGALSGDPRWPLWNGSPVPIRRSQRMASLAPDSTVDASATISHSVIGSGAQVGANARIESSVLMPGVVVGPGCKLRGALLAEGCRVPAGLVIGVDALHDRRRFELTPGGVIVVTPASLAASG